MASDKSSRNNWVASPPSAHDIVACYFPEQGSSPGQHLKLRPALVLNVYQGRKTGTFACEVAFGTKSLKIMRRQHVDLIVQNAVDLRLLGLATATRFDLDRILKLPWSEKYFGCWSTRTTPFLGSLTDVYVKEYAYCMMVRSQMVKE